MSKHRAVYSKKKVKYKIQKIRTCENCKYCYRITTLWCSYLRDGGAKNHSVDVDGICNMYKREV